MTLAPPSQREIELTPGEWRVYCALRYDGAGNEIIARRLGIALDTVKTHMRRIMVKAGCDSRAALLAAELNDEITFRKRPGRC
jgi:DNA-binding NarL/FixJ family response regulator